MAQLSVISGVARQVMWIAGRAARAVHMWPPPITKRHPVVLTRLSGPTAGLTIPNHTMNIIDTLHRYVERVDGSGTASSHHIQIHTGAPRRVL